MSLTTEIQVLVRQVFGQKFLQRTPLQQGTCFLPRKWHSHGWLVCEGYICLQKQDEAQQKLHPKATPSNSSYRATCIEFTHGQFQMVESPGEVE